MNTRKRKNGLLQFHKLIRGVRGSSEMAVADGLLRFSLL